VSDVEMERVKTLANKIIKLLNAAQHPADALTALQLVTAAIVDTMGIDPAVWMHRVLVSVERIRNGDVVTKEPSNG
jgi:hypothetical protein